MTHKQSAHKKQITTNSLQFRLKSSTMKYGSCCMDSCDSTVMLKPFVVRQVETLRTCCRATNSNLFDTYNLNWLYVVPEIGNNLCVSNGQVTLYHEDATYDQTVVILMGSLHFMFLLLLLIGWEGGWEYVQFYVLENTLTPPHPTPPHPTPPHAPPTHAPTHPPTHPNTTPYI